MDVLISLGANLTAADGSAPLDTCRQAAAALDALPGLRLRGLSRWYRTAPMLAPGQNAAAHPSYVNGVAHLVSRPGVTVDPAWLLAELMQLEAAAGRHRSTLNAPRPLDLDIIAMGDMVRDHPDPVLPHPRAHLRAFVLVPLAELAPGWLHPRLGQPVETLIAGLPEQAITPL